MKKAIILLLSVGLTLTVGCSQKTPEVKPNVDEKIVYPGPNTTNSEYDEYLLLMEDSQRARFFKLSSDLQKQRFLQAEGIIRKKELNDTLSTSMSTNECPHTHIASTSLQSLRAWCRTSNVEHVC